jgi:hypothetical protein
VNSANSANSASSASSANSANWANSAGRQGLPVPVDAPVTPAHQARTTCPNFCTDIVPVFGQEIIPDFSFPGSSCQTLHVRIFIPDILFATDASTTSPSPPISLNLRVSFSESAVDSRDQKININYLVLFFSLGFSCVYPTSMLSGLLCSIFWYCNFGYLEAVRAH